MNYRLLSAAAVSFSLLASAASTQDLGLKQLQDSATAGMSQLGMDVSMVEMLTLEELAQIRSITGGGDAEETKTRRIETILRDAEGRIAAGGAVTPQGTTGDISADDLEGDMVVKANVGAFLAQLGMAEQVDVDTLTTDELLQVQLVQGTDDTMEEKRMAIEELLEN
ncbi:MAG: hypothetical protein H0T41_06540 [Rhodobacteraceae bacterium]|nr:hypothetical protein [Paracoccaceae bacterium]